MNRVIVIAVALAFAFPATAMAFNFLFFDYEAYGSVLYHPAAYSGPLTSSATGTFGFVFDDTGWPDPSTPNARLDFIFNTYFASNYDNSTPGAFTWKGEILATYTLSITDAPPGLVGDISGGFFPEITLKDENGDGIWNPYERYKRYFNNSINGSFTIGCGVGTGDFECQSGSGSMQGNHMTFNPAEPDTIIGSGSIFVDDCSSAIEPSSWGSVKALYR